MRAQGLSGTLQMEDFQVMGFTDVLLSLPKLWKQFHLVVEYLLKTDPKAVILIDYPGFNLRLAKAARKKGYRGKIVQYISPSVWAHGKQRIAKMASTLDLLLTIYPFEKNCFAETSLPVKYVGNPLVEILRHHQYQERWKEIVGLPENRTLIALFSGSRPSEIKHNLPQILEACERFRQKNPTVIFGLSVANEQLLPLIQEITGRSTLANQLFLIPKEYRYELMRDCRTAVAKSGTVTLELALHRKPTVVVYHVTRLNRLIAQYLLRLSLPHYCIVNILLGKRVFPEMIEEGYTGSSLEQQLSALDAPGPLRENCLAGCDQVVQLLQCGNPSEQAAEAISELLQDRKDG